MWLCESGENTKFLFITYNFYPYDSYWAGNRVKPFLILKYSTTPSISTIYDYKSRVNYTSFHFLLFYLPFSNGFEPTTIFFSLFTIFTGTGLYSYTSFAIKNTEKILFVWCSSDFIYFFCWSWWILNRFSYYLFFLFS